jgi:hypothetical protein
MSFAGLVVGRLASLWISQFQISKTAAAGGRVLLWLPGNELFYAEKTMLIMAPRLSANANSYLSRQFFMPAASGCSHELRRAILQACRWRASLLVPFYCTSQVMPWSESSASSANLPPPAADDWTWASKHMP